MHQAGANFGGQPGASMPHNPAGLPSPRTVKSRDILPAHHLSAAALNLSHDATAGVPEHHLQHLLQVALGFQFVTQGWEVELKLIRLQGNERVMRQLLRDCRFQLNFFYQGFRVWCLCLGC